METSVIQQCSDQSMKGSITFRDVVVMLQEAGIESYYTDLVCLNKIYYSLSDEFHIDALQFTPSKIAKDFCIKGVKEAIVSSQKGEIPYKEFLKKIMESGVTRYIVFIQGKKVMYFGRNGDFHVENFPQSKSF